MIVQIICRGLLDQIVEADPATLVSQAANLDPAVDAEAFHEAGAHPANGPQRDV